MDNVVESIFGLSPAQIQQRQNVGMMTAANNYANQDPLQRAAASMFAGGGMLAGAGAQAAGMMTPEMQQAQMTEQALQGLDTSDPKAVFERASQIQDPRLKLRLVQMARQIQAEQSKQALEAAHAKYYEMGGSQGRLTPSQLVTKQAIARNDALKAGFQMGLKGQELLDFVDQQVEAMTRQWNETAGTTPKAEEVSISPSSSVSSDLKITQAQKDAMIADLESRGDIEGATKAKEIPVVPDIVLPLSKPEVAGKVALEQTISQNNPTALSTGARAKESGKSGAELNIKEYEIAKGALNNLAEIDRLEKHLATAQATTGLGANLINGINRAKALLGGAEGARKASDTEILDVLTGSEVFPLIKSLGIGARGMDTPAEREFMRSVLTGSVSLNAETLRKMAEFRRQAAQREVDNWNARVDSGDLNDFFSETRRAKKELEPYKYQDVAPVSKREFKVIR